MRGTVRWMNRSRNSYIRAPRSVTEAPIGSPARRPKFAIAFLARVITGLLPGDDRQLLGGRIDQPRILGAFAHARR